MLYRQFSLTKWCLLPFAAAAAGLLSCSTGDRFTLAPVVPSLTQDLSLAQRQPQGFVPLPFDRLPNMNVNVESCRNYMQPLDTDSVELFAYNGALYYHPVFLCHRALGFIAAYVKTGESVFLIRAKRTVAALMRESEPHDEAFFAPYLFDYNVHADPKNNLPAPWFSGMGQGELLEVTVRIFELTSDSAYLAFSDRVFASLEQLRETGSPWVTSLDQDQYYWIEEYPLERGMDQTLNGFIAAVFGVYDYYRVTRSERARALYECCLTTLKAYLPEFRRPGQRSYYCLGHKVVATEGYHQFHCSQLHNLARITGDVFFEDVARLFESDVAEQ